ncbi:hypothetical protein [Nocardioides cynanchi]|uniref:hypothetical protein n=1 Tax=Nocardioides cynanchi TaxID=2558918 RepID=UPI001244EA5F|nr:hypothetical protein [Nocardioides cynanchi]
MTILRRTFALVACLSTGTVLAASLQTASSARTVDERCIGRGPIPAAALAHGSGALGCSLVGRVVTAGRVSVVVPPAGVTVAGDGIGRHGEVTGLRVANIGSDVRAVLGSATGSQGAGAASDPPACHDRTFHLEGHRWATSLRYRVALSNAPRRFHHRILTRQIKAADVNMRSGRNTCGKPHLRTPVGHYLGHTSARPNIKPGTSGIKCGAYNTHNVVGFGRLPGGLLGWTCYWYLNRTGHMGAADIMLDTGKALTTKLPSPCTNQWDFEGIVTHEFGHAYGMGHTGSGHSHLTMQHAATPCSTYARTLGIGDWLGMKKMYGAK